MSNIWREDDSDIEPVLVTATTVRVSERVPKVAVLLALTPLVYVSVALLVRSDDAVNVLLRTSWLMLCVNVKVNSVVVVLVGVGVRGGDVVFVIVSVRVGVAVPRVGDIKMDAVPTARVLESVAVGVKSDFVRASLALRLTDPPSKDGDVVCVGVGGGVTVPDREGGSDMEGLVDGTSGESDHVWPFVSPRVMVAANVVDTRGSYVLVALLCTLNVPSVNVRVRSMETELECVSDSARKRSVRVHVAE